MFAFGKIIFLVILALVVLVYISRPLWKPVGKVAQEEANKIKHELGDDK